MTGRSDARALLPFGVLIAATTPAAWAIVTIARRRRSWAIQQEVDPMKYPAIPAEAPAEAPVRTAVSSSGSAGAR